MSHVRSATLFGSAGQAQLDFTLLPGELALIDARDPTLAAGFADLCCGLEPIDEGTVRFLDRDWSALPHDLADALRGQIGCVMASAGWLRFLDIATNILVAPLYHTNHDLDRLRGEAAALARRFGLPGIPAGPIDSLSQDDLLRAGFVRAFLGDPKLVILESPVQGLFPDLVPILLNQIAVLRDQGGAAIWLTRSRLVWDNRSFPATHRLRLGYRGFVHVHGSHHPAPAGAHA
ncbi:P-loop NTPase family protein [Dongia deserti]|uniref:organic solvent ABC transporter ATP-binding protein n=1 Tax=Dongia deserti TaxID=2268030 RepID=UPI0013C401EE|nr:organic solvent ABC transporter ATP-binding protein [Dongia deserti]